jgi:hypothetical protein
MLGFGTLANKNTPYYGAGASGNLPSKAPTIPTKLSGTQTSLIVEFDVAGITGPAPLEYGIVWGTSTDPVTPVPAILQSGTIYAATVSGLLPSTEYYFKSVASNTNGSVISNVSSAITTDGTAAPPNFAPSIPDTATSNNPETSITVYFNVAGVTGSPEPTYSILWGGTVNPNQTAPAVNAFGSLYTATVTGLTSGFIYYFKSVATNASGSVSSDLSFGFQTGSGSGTAPNQAPSVPTVSGTPTASSITVTFDITGVTGSPTPTYSLLYGTTTTPSVPLVATLTTGTTYTGTATGLAPGSTYYFKSVASNGVNPNQISAVSAAITTGAAPAPTELMTNVVLPFLVQGPRFGSTSPWAGIDYYLATPATGAVYAVGGSTTSGQQLFGSMYAGTVGDAGNLSGDPANVVPYAGSCTADQVFSYDFGSTSDAYLNGVQSNMGNKGLVLASWGGFTADVRGLFGPYVPTGYPGSSQPTAQQVIQSFLYNYAAKKGFRRPDNFIAQITSPL